MKLSKSVSLLPWVFRVTQLSPTSWTVEFQSPWNRRWENISSWSTMEGAEAARSFYERNLNCETH